MHEFNPIALLDLCIRERIAGEDPAVVLHHDHARLQLQLPQERPDAHAVLDHSGLAVQDDGHFPAPPADPGRPCFPVALR